MGIFRLVPLLYLKTRLNLDPSINGSSERSILLRFRLAMSLALRENQCIWISDVEVTGSNVD